MSVPDSFSLFQDVDMDLDYNGGFSMKILIKTSMSLPGTSLELPATAIINVNKLYGKVSSMLTKHDR